MLESVIIPDGIQEIKRMVFYGCSALPEKPESLGESALNCCPLQSVTIPETLTEISYVLSAAIICSKK